ncbi:hypothetical protein [Erythrobacter sp. MTPC3]|uniref:hypothetical protein n=1 Tax=Erythrobacter sp. MTPC3 TaxID=3056564 RepID=UPI0036F20CA2
MVDFDLGEACPRRKLSYALADAMDLPIDPGPGTNAVKLGILDYPSEEAIDGLALAAIAGRQDELLSLFADRSSESFICLALLYRTRDGVETIKVDPCRLKRGKPIILVSADRRRAFKLDDRCILTTCPVPTRAKLARGIENAWADLRASMQNVAVDPRHWDQQPIGEPWDGGFAAAFRA